MGIELIRGAVVMVNFMCQLGQSNTILHISVTMFLDEIYIQISGLRVKQIALHYVGGPHPIS